MLGPTSQEVPSCVWNQGIVVLLLLSGAPRAVARENPRETQCVSEGQVKEVFFAETVKCRQPYAFLR